MPPLVPLLLILAQPPAEALPAPQAVAPQPVAPPALPVPAAPLNPAADPEATAQFRAALDGRATWFPFAGFEATLDVRYRGQSQRGAVKVAPDGAVAVGFLDPAAAAWAEEKLTFIVKQRLPQALPPDAVYLEPEAGNPLGRPMRVLADPFGTVYRLQAGQILALERTAAAGRLVILVQRNELNAEGKQLPTAYTAHYWSPLSGALTRTETYTQNWARVGPVDLPTRVLVTTARGGALDVDQIVLTEHRVPAPLLAPPAPLPGAPPAVAP